MNILKKYTAAVLTAFCVLLTAFSVSAAKPEITTMPSEEEIITTVGILGIFNGDYYGDLHLDNYVTRAEFTKIAICTSNLKDSVNTSSRVSPFSDVNPGHWASGYIVTAVENKYLRGYVDGSFKPDNKVTLEEAVTVMLRLLGYSELDSGKYPDAQLAKYGELCMGYGITATRGQALTRRDCMYLIYNVLCTETKAGNVYCKSLGYSSDTNGRIDYLSLISNNMEGPVTVNADGSYTEKVGIEYARATFYRDGKKANAEDLQVYDLVYYNRDTRTIWAYTDKTMGLVNSVSVAGVTTTSPDYTGKSATSSGGGGGNGGSQTVTSSSYSYSDGSKSTSTSVSGSNSYSSQTSDTGGYSSSYSSTSVSASSGNIIVSGTSYKLGNQDVTRKFASDGTLNCDDFVMLMIDKDGNVGDAVLADSSMFEKYITEDADKTAIINSSLKGPYTVKEDANPDLPFDISESQVYIKGVKSSADKIRKYDVYYYSVPFKSVWVYRDSKSGIVDSINTGGVVTKSENYTGNGASYSDSVVVSGVTYSLGNEEVKYKFSIYGEISTDDFVLLLMGRDGNVADAVVLDSGLSDYLDEEDKVDVINSTLKGPYTAKSEKTVEDTVPFSLDSATIYYGTKLISAADISEYDVFYYSEPFKSVWIYRDTAIGIVDSVNVSGVVTTSTRYSGNAASSGAIVLGSKSYTLGSDTVINKFSAYGSLSVDDFVMLLLDKDGKVADAVVADSKILEKFLDEDDDRVALINSTLKGPYVLKAGEAFGNKIPFSVETAKIYLGSKEVTPLAIGTNDVYYYSEPFNSIWIYRDTATGFVTAINPSREAPTSVTVGSKSYTLEGSTIKQQFSNFGTFEKDDFVTVLLGNGGTAVYAIEGDIYDYLQDNDDGVTYADLVSQSMEGPVVVKPGADWKSKIPFEISEATFYKKNSTVSSDTVKNYDVLYYSKALSSVWIYTDKATGTFEAASPNRISPTSVTVSGKTYSLESTGASFALSNLGEYKLGDTVTLLLGKNGGAVDVIPANESSESVYGFISAFGEGTYQRPNGTTYTAENITVLGTDGQSYTYEYPESGFTKGDFVNVIYIDGKVRINEVKSNVSSAEATNINSLIGAGKIADSAVLLDVYVTTDSDSLENKSVAFCELYPARLANAKLKASDIYYAKTENGEITELILKDFTGDIHTYGIITMERSGGDFVYKMINDAGTKEIALSAGYGTPVIGAARFTVKGGKYIVKNLESKQVEEFARGYCTADGKTYSYASDVEFYINTGAREFEPTTYDDIAEGKYKITAYYDDTMENGGRVRIIIAE